MNSIVHDIRNQLAVATANIEAFLDGKLEPTKTRLEAVHAALADVDVLLNELVNDLREMEDPFTEPSR